MGKTDSDVFYPVREECRADAPPTRFVPKAAMKLAPERKKFMEILHGNNSGDLNADIQKFSTIFPPMLEENHKFLDSVGMDNLKA